MGSRNFRIVKKRLYGNSRFSRFQTKCTRNTSNRTFRLCMILTQTTNITTADCMNKLKKSLDVGTVSRKWPRYFAIQLITDRLHYSTSLDSTARQIQLINQNFSKSSKYNQFSMQSCSRAASSSLRLRTVLYTCQLFLRYRREIFILGVLGFLKMTRSFPNIPEEVRSLLKKSEVFRRHPKMSHVRKLGS